MCAIPVAFFVAVLGIPFVQEQLLLRSLPKYSASAKVMQDVAVYGANSALKSVLYWSPDSIETIRQFYENESFVFEESIDDYGSWLIAGVDDATRDGDFQTLYITHESFCNYKEHYHCATLALVDAAAEEFYRLPIISPSQFRLDAEPPELAQLPDYGVIIVLSYYVDDY
jgi:hypothetical protein